jgi:hypothetical protein
MIAAALEAAAAQEPVVYPYLNILLFLNVYFSILSLS